MRELVTVVIPVRGAAWSPKHDILFDRIGAVLGDFPATFVAGTETGTKSLEERWPDSHVYRFDSLSGDDGDGFTKLLLAADFYEMFGWCEYMLLVEPNVFLVKNELKYWCKQGYDYLYGGNGLFSLRHVDRFRSLAKKDARAIYRFTAGRESHGSADQAFWVKKTKGFWPALQSPTEIVRSYFSVSAERAEVLSGSKELPFAITDVDMENTGHESLVRNLSY